MNTTQIGDISEQVFVLRCLEKSVPVCKPVGNNLPYDYVIEYNGKLSKVQVKTARESKHKDVIIFNTKSISKNYNGFTEKDYIGKIDYFLAVYKNICYLVPIEDSGAGTTSIYLGDNPDRFKRNHIDYLF